LSATRNRSSRPTTSVSRPTESSCRSTTRSSDGLGSRERPSSSRSTRAISPSTSSMRNEPRHARELALPRRPERLLLDAHPHAQQRQVDEREREGAEEGAVGKRDAEHLDGDGEVGRHHSSSTISEQKPGPMARRSPRSPGRASPEPSRSESTKRTEAEERFPTLCRESQLRCMAGRESSSASSTASSTLGPPVWQ